MKSATKATRQSFIEAYKASPVTPCDKYSCAKRKCCSEKALACSAFSVYVEHGAALNPAYLYDRRGKEIHGVPMPTNSVYRAVMAS